jgi:hypothetical protein
VAANISALIAIVAALIASVQVVLMRTSSRADVLSQAMRHYWNAEHRQHREIVYGLEGKPFPEWSESEIEAATEVAIQVSQLGFLVKQSYADRNAFLDFWGPWYIKSYQIVAPLIADRRARWGAPSQWVYFEWLARSAALHLRKPPWWQGKLWLQLKRKTGDLADPSATIESIPVQLQSAEGATVRRSSS